MIRTSKQFNVFIAALEAINKQYTSYRNEHVSVYGNKNKLQVTQYLTLQVCTKFQNMNRLQLKTSNKLKLQLSRRLEKYTYNFT